VNSSHLTSREFISSYTTWIHLILHQVNSSHLTLREFLSSYNTRIHLILHHLNSSHFKTSSVYLYVQLFVFV